MIGKKVWKAAKGTSKLLVKLRKKKLKLEEDPSFDDQTVEGASTEAKNNLRILKGMNLYICTPYECLGATFVLYESRIRISNHIA